MFKEPPPLTANYDESWKEALTEYFESFLTFFFPEVHELIDWTKTPRSLDKELQLKGTIGDLVPMVIPLEDVKLV